MHVTGMTPPGIACRIRKATSVSNPPASPHRNEAIVNPARHEDVDLLGPVPVAQPGADRHHDALGEAVGGADPLAVGRADAQLELDGRQGDVDDARVEDRHEHPDHEHTQGGQPRRLTAVVRDGVRGGGRDRSGRLPGPGTRRRTDGHGGAGSGPVTAGRGRRDGPPSGSVPSSRTGRSTSTCCVTVGHASPPPRCYGENVPKWGVIPLFETVAGRPWRGPPRAGRL